MSGDVTALAEHEERQRLLRELGPVLIGREGARAARAREDVAAFFEFVMREQTTRRPIKCLPHQRVALDFMLHHDRSVLVLPVGASKTFMLVALSLFFMGQDPTLRGAIVSATQAQAAKLVSVVSDYVKHSPELRMVFPNLVPSTRPHDKWTQTAIIVDRPPGIPDPSLVAIGIDGGIAGARLNWVIVDDILNRENVATKEQRDKVREFVDSTVLARLDPKNARVVLSNSAWHPEDLLHQAEAQGWATLRMDALGNVSVQDDEAWMRQGRAPWEHVGLRPATTHADEVRYRLRAHDPDPGNVKSLWPGRFTEEWFAEKRATHLPQEFNRLFLCQVRDDSSSFCKVEWVEKCKAEARRRGVSSLVSEYRGPHPTFTGVDLAFRKGEHADLTAFFTFAALPSGHREILDVEFGQWDGPTIVEKVIQKHRAYGSIVRIENNAGQEMLLHFARGRDVSVPIKPHTTGTNKANPDYGVQSVFLDMMNAAWLIPNDARGEVHPAVRKWIDECLYYVPSKHTGDVLMSAWFAREQAREFGALHKQDGAANGSGLAIAQSLLTR